jgi:cytoskeletal protein CcmA (bactofilin family)
MWKKEDAKPQGISPSPVSTTNVAPAAPSASTSMSPSIAALPISPGAAACISQGIRIKGEVTGSENLFVDGLVDGKLSLTNGTLTIGPNGSVKADVLAREVVVRGKIEGKVSGREKVQLWSTAHVIGEVQTERLVIEEGALLRGKVEAGRQPGGRTAESKMAVSSISSKPVDSLPVNSRTAAI